MNEFVFVIHLVSCFWQLHLINGRMQIREQIWRALSIAVTNNWLSEQFIHHVAAVSLYVPIYESYNIIPDSYVTPTFTHACVLVHRCWLALLPKLLVAGIWRAEKNVLAGTTFTIVSGHWIVCISPGALATSNCLLSLKKCTSQATFTNNSASFAILFFSRKFLAISIPLWQQISPCGSNFQFALFRKTVSHFLVGVSSPVDGFLVNTVLWWLGCLLELL